MLLVETPESLEVTQGRAVVYRWGKGQPWAEITSPLFWLV